MTLEDKRITTKFLKNLGNFVEFAEFQRINEIFLKHLRVKFKKFLTVLHFLSVDKKIIFTINTTTNSYLWVT